MMKKFLSIITLGLVVGFISPNLGFGQSIGEESLRQKLESVLYRFKNYRYSTISIYQIKDIRDFRNAISKADEATTEQNTISNSDAVKKLSDQDRKFYKGQIDQGKSANQIRSEMMNIGMPIPDDFDAIYKELAIGTIGPPKIKSAYVVTTRMNRGQIEPSTVIALITSNDMDDYVSKNINMVGPKSIYTNPELFTFALDQTEYRAANMYELVMNAFRQNNIKNVTLEAQGIGGMQSFYGKTYGNTLSLVANENEVSSYDVQSFLRISDGQPADYKDVKNEVIASPDLISWKHYDVVTRTYSDGVTDTITSVVNKDLPKYGAELRYGIDDIGYPGFWSERLTLNAIWENVKLGVILPTNGWSSLSKDLYDVDRSFTHAGTGLNFKADFPVKIIPQSGIFSINFGYVFGDAKEADYKNRKLTDPETYTVNPLDNDYLVRFNGSLHYTFGIAIDEDYLLRFGIGASLYSVESWYYNVRTDSTDEGYTKKFAFEKNKSETIGGISGRVEFMAKNVATPFGATLQYFDESLFANLWLQIPIVKNQFALRLEAKSFMTAFKDKPRAWEKESVVMPTARFIITF